MTRLLITFLAVILSAQLFAQCNEFFPLKENVRYEYEMYDKKEKMTFKMSHTMKNVSGSGDNMSATLAQDMYDPKKGDKISSSELNWTCENGVLHFDMKSMSLTMDNGQQMNMGETGMSMDVTGDRLDLPSNLSVGQTLKDVSYNIKMAMGNMTLMNRTFHVKDRKVEAQENITTPAGTFSCYKVTYITSDDKGRNSSKSAVWYAKDAGMVKSEMYTDDGKLTNRQLLVKIEK
ncbi:hypothetical protein [Chryseolinea sp. H1M3-3]|uniref:TapB family protein n=1 Tax=Chryseolinea sp. H1M3-3 TaxID=3034144 RepID=UPI0023EAD907|nr:hypothetical protein [Chryseolinea sp. H1M3-3]